VARTEEARGAVVPLPFVGDEHALLDGIRNDSPAAIAAFCDRYGDQVMRVLARVMGPDGELEDLHHEVFLRALKSAPGVNDASSLSAWVTAIAVNVARTELKRRARRRWFTPLATWEQPDVEAPAAKEEDVEALHRTYALLERMPVDLRVPLSLSIIEGMKLEEVAAACDVSLSTIKRRLSRAERRFVDMARRDPVLAVWLTRGTRWNDQ
jgi:RNA polymerase sigma-70 factor (ECF subfamily)